MFDNTLELLVLAGRPLAHAMMMLIPSRGPTTSRWIRSAARSTNTIPA